MERRTPTDEQHDRALLARIAQRDGRAIAELERRYGPRLAVFIRHWISDPHLAEEVVQDVFWSVWRDAGRFRGESRISTWLLGIARHKAISATRKRWPEPMDPHASDGRDGNTPGAGWPSASENGPCRSLSTEPEERMEQIEAAARIRNALGRLSPAHRATLELVFFHELKLREVAEIMRCPEGTVKSRLAYAKRRLRSILQSDRPSKTRRHDSDRRRPM